MSKPRPDRDIHQAIRETAARFRDATTHEARDAVEYPEVDALLTAARHAIERSVPTSFVFAGRVYGLRARLNAIVQIHEPGASRPLIEGGMFDFDEASRKPRTWS